MANNNAANKDVYEIDLGGFTSSEDDEYEEKKPDVTASTPSRSSRSSHSNVANNDNKTQTVASNTSTRSISIKSNKSIKSIKSTKSTKSQSDILANGVNQLSAYYGTPTNKNKYKDNTPSISCDELRYDFKSKYFDANKFVEKKVSDMTVSELVLYSNELNHGVKALDSEMQMMVYDNYNKFISATDTIRKMKDQVENMENEMSKLLANMNNIATNCGEIESKFSKNRSEIEKLVSVRGLLKKLEFLFELPNRLKKNIELGDYERAIKYFKMATKILVKYKHIPSFHRISIESQEIINDLRENLKKQMISKNIISSKQLEIAKLLLSLNQEPELLWYDIFKTRKDSLLTTIIKLKTSDKIINYFKSQNEEISKHKPEQLLPTQQKNEQKFEETNPFQTDSTNPFQKDIEENVENKNVEEKNEKKIFFSVIDFFRINFLSLFIDFVEEYNAVFITPFKAQRYEKSMAALTSFTRDIFFEYFNVIKSELQKENNIDKLTEELELFYDGLYKPSKLVPNAKLQDRGTEIIEHCIRRSMEREFKRTRESQLLFVCDYLRDNYDINKIEFQAGKNSNEYHLKKCVSRIRILGIDCLNHLVPLTTNQSPLINILDLNFDDQLWSYTANIFKIFADIIPIELRANDQTNTKIITNLVEGFDDENHIFIQSIYDKLYFELQPIKLLILSKILIGVKSNVVEEIIKHFKKNYLYKNTASLGIYKQELLLFKQYCQDCSTGLRLMYSQRISQDIIILINKLEADFSNFSETQRQEIITNIRMKINNAIENMKKIYNISRQLIQCHILSSQLMNNNNLNVGDISVGIKPDNLRKYDKLFNEQSLIYDIVDDTANDVLFTIYKIIFKHWSEILRTKIITNKQKDFIQADVKYFRNNIPKIIVKKDFKKLQTLLDEIQQTAKERCVVNAINDNDTVDID